MVLLVVIYMREPLDLAGQKFGKLTAIKIIENKKQIGNIWLCKCDCGNFCNVPTSRLRSGNTKSCGCLKSYGETIIKKILFDNNILYETQKTFDGCRFPTINAMARFDFYIENNYLIEFDGKQHFEIGNQS